VGRYIIKRLLGIIPMLLLISILTYALMYLAPGGPMGVLANNPEVTGEDILRLKKNFGLDRPWYVQYFKWLERVVFHMDFGYSFSTGQPVQDMILERLPATLELMGTAFLAAVILGILIGIVSAVFRYSLFDYLASFFSFVGISIPVFWSAILAILIFVLYLGWLPSSGRLTIGVPYSFIDHLRHLILPSCVLALLYLSEWSRYMRSCMLETLQQDYIQAARAKGLSEWKVVLKHGLRNALIPVLTMMTLHLPTLFTGAIITESIFSWPGMGGLFYNGIELGDYPRIMGILFISSFLIILFNLAADVLYVFIDPRVKYAKAGI
jgi:peptide/nickel transport system permease protein